MSLPVDHHAIEAAAERIAPYVVRTPAVAATALSDLTRASVFLKLETFQRTGAFKDRGAANRMLQLDASERERGVVAMSAGNHAQAVAYVARRLGIVATIVMPEDTPFTKIRRTRNFGARVVLAGRSLAEAAARANEFVDDEGLTLVHPYDDPRIVAGAGTVGLEFAQDVPDLDIAIVPIGGGGLISGFAVALKTLSPKTQILGVQTLFFPSFFQIRNDLPLVHGGRTIAEGIAVGRIGDVPLAIARELVDDVVLVSEGSIERAVHTLVEEEKLVSEGAGAAGLAAMLDDPSRFAGKRVGLVVCGGNIDTGLLANVMARVRLREGRVVRMRVAINDRPGVLAEVARLIGEVGANILEVVHLRHQPDVSSRDAELDITFEIRAPADLEAIVVKLHAAEYRTTILESSPARVDVVE